MTTRKTIPIRYTSRDFETIKADLIEHAKRYYPDTYKDFNEAGFGSMMLDTVAYVGDILSFYLDYQVNESFLDSAVEYNNILRLGKQFGYKFLGEPSSFGQVTLYIVVPASTTTEGPDANYLPVLKRGSIFESVTGNSFILNENVDFAHSDNEVVVGRVNESTGVPTHYAIRAYGQVMSGRYGAEYITIGDYEKFKKVELSAPNVSEIISVTDSEGHEYYEVDFLSQNVVYKPTLNRNADTRENALNLLRPLIVPRRFVVDREKRKLNLLFGHGTDLERVEPSVADPSSVVYQMQGKNYVASEYFDPTKLLETDKFGIAPANTTLKVVYRYNTEQNVNASVETVTRVSQAYFEFDSLSDLSGAEVSAVQNSLESTNEEEIVGDTSVPDSDELKVRIYDKFSSQGRAVTIEDYKSMVYSLPPQFGSIKRVNVVRDPNSARRNLNIYAISENRGGYLTQTNQTIKENLRIWLLKNKMINDTIDILDARIVNLGFEFEILGSLDRNKYAILEEAVQKLRTHFATVGGIGEDFYITDVYNTLKDVDDVLDVTRLSVFQKTGSDYSDVRFNVQKNMSADGRYIKCPGNVIFEIKFPWDDIKGAIK